MDAFESNDLRADKKSDVVRTEEPVAQPDQLLECCKATIKMHAANNPMMVCSDCKQIIKCFDDERAFKNYQRFCASRHRRILATVFENRFIVVFKSYDTYST